MQLGLTPPSTPSSAALRPLVKQSAINIGGLMGAQPLSVLMEQDRTKAATEAAARAAQQPVVQGLVQMLNTHWELAKTAKQEVEQSMLDAVRARAGRYPAAMEARLAEQGGSSIYMMLFATKARQAKALLNDVLVGSGAEKPWTLSPSPKPDIPPEEVRKILTQAQQDVARLEMAGQDVPVPVIAQALRDARDELENRVMATARDEAKACEKELEDVLVEGGFLEAVDEFLDDLTTFKSAFIKRELVMDNVLEWTRGPDGASVATVATKLKMRFSRVDPFMIYPLPWSRTVNDPMFERMPLTRGALFALIGVEGYSEDAVRAALDEHGSGGLHNWLQVDVEKAQAENRPADAAHRSETLDALRYWGSVSGKMLKEWGMEGVTDDAKEYPVEILQVGEHVIKCVLNEDPLARRPYYSDGYSRVPGAFWHNSLYDLVHDTCDMCNSTARALANNLGISSGPQVGVNIDRIAAGEDVSQMFPWKIWQFNNDPMGSSAPPLSFFQPQSNAAELMGVYETFSRMADEYSGVPRYMTGTEGTPGAGRTASGLSMMVGNASKVIKSLVGSLDIRIITPLLRQLFDWKMQHDPEFKYRGDLQIVPRGALSLQVKESANQARMQFLQATGNPVDLQIVGPQGRQVLLREVAKNLNMNPDDIVPSMTKMRMQQMEQAMAQQNQPQQNQPQQKPPAVQGGNQVLQDGTPQTDNFSPTKGQA